MAKEVEALTVLLAARTAEFERGMASAERRIDKVERRMRGSTAIIERDAARMAQKVSRSFDEVGKSFNLSGAAIGGLGLAALTSEAVKYSDAWTRAGNSLKIAGVATDQQKTVMDALFGSAQRNAVGVETLTDLYGKAALSAKTLGASQNDLIKFSDGIAVALKASGTTAQAASGALTQLGQALGAGIVRAEEFNSILEGAPAIARAVAAGLDGVNGDIGKLRQLMLAGGLSSKDFFDAFLKGKPVIDDMAARALPTVANAITRINNSLTKYVGENSGAQGATRALIGGLNSLADNFETAADYGLKFAAVIAAALLGRSIAGMIVSLGNGAVAIRGFAATLAAARTAGGISALSSAAGGLAAAAGPIGAILGVAAAAGLYWASSGRQATTDTNSAADSAERYAEALKRVKGEAPAAGDAVKASAGQFAETEKNRLAGQLQEDKQAAEEAAEAVRAYLDTLIETAPRRLISQQQLGQLQALRDRIGTNVEAAVELQEAISRLANLNPKFQRMKDQLQPLLDQLIATREAARQTGEELEQIDVRGRRGPSRIQGEAYRGEAERAAPGGFNSGVAQLESDARKEAAKGDREKSIDKQTGDLVKSYEATGQKITDAVREALRGVAEAIVDAERSRKETEKLAPATGVTEAADLIKKFEGFRSGAYYDVNAFRAGYGSDTTTDASGRVSRVTKDTVTNVEDATRDLNRRIGEFQNTIRGQIGSSTFDQFSKEQQAALTSIAYNYGSLPDRIVNAIKTGTTEDVEKAIRGLGSDNGGVNRSRRNQEADVFGGGATPQAKEADKRIEFQRDFEKDAQRKREDLDLELRRTEAKDGFNFALEKEAKLLQLKREAQDANIPLDEAELARLEARAQKETELAQAVEDAEKRKQAAKQATKGVAEAEEFFADQATSAFTDIVTGAATAEQALKKLVNAFLEAAIQATLLGKGPLAGIFGTASSGGGLGGVAGLLFGSGKASGGRVSKGQVYPVGENGREFFAPGESGRIIPEAALRPNIVQARTSQTRISPSVRMSIDLRGANGDATIERISRQAAAQAGQEAYRQAVRDSARQSGRSQMRRDVHGQDY